MAAMLESEPYFLAKLEQIGTSKLFKANFKSYGRLAFCCSTVPGQDEIAFKEFAVKLNEGADPSDDELAILRRAFYEAHALVVADLRHRADRTEETAPKKLPTAESSSTLSSQQARLSGLDLHGELEPANQLIDMIADMKEQDALVYIPPEKCIKRSAEVQGKKNEQALSLSNRKLTITQGIAEVSADVSIELRLKNAMVRRALAFDQFSLLGLDAANLWIEYLFNQLARTPPTTHHPITLKQIIEADRQTWLRMAGLARKGINPDSTGNRPLETALQEAKQDPMVMAFLAPLPKPASSGSSAESSTRQQPQKRPRSQPPQPKAGGNKQRRFGQPVPTELVGLSPRSKDGAPICFAFNLKGCHAATTDNKCPKGLHVCMRCGSSAHGGAKCSR